MIRKSLILCFCSVVLVGCAGVGDGGAPSAEELFSRFVETAYGDDGMAARLNITTTATMVVDEFGISAPIVTRQMAPNFLITESTIMGSVLTQGCRDDVCWEQQPGQSPRPAQGEKLGLMQQQADFYQWENIDRYYESIEVLPEPEQASADGESADYYRVRGVRPSGREDYYHFSKSTGLLVGSELLVETPMGPTRVVSRLNDYQNFGPIMLPTETIQETPMATVRIEIEDVSFENLSEADFPLPEQISTR